MDVCARTAAMSEPSVLAEKSDRGRRPVKGDDRECVFLRDEVSMDQLLAF